MDKLKPGIDVSEQETERISNDVMAGLRTIEAENFLLHNDFHTRNDVPREGDRSPVVIDFGEATSGSQELAMKVGERISGCALYEEASGGSC